jgi:hypothetical protein
MTALPADSITGLKSKCRCRRWKIDCWRRSTELPRWLKSEGQFLVNNFNSRLTFGSIFGFLLPWWSCQPAALLVWKADVDVGDERLTAGEGALSCQDNWNQMAKSLLAQLFEYKTHIWVYNWISTLMTALANSTADLKSLTIPTISDRWLLGPYRRGMAKEGVQGDVFFLLVFHLAGRSIMNVRWMWTCYWVQLVAMGPWRNR